MEQIAEVYARSLFEVALEHGTLDTVRDQLVEFDDALAANPDLGLFFFSPNFSTEEKISGLRSAIDGADPAVQNFLEALLERHRMPAIHRIRARFDRLWEQQMKVLPVEVTSAVELDEATVSQIGDRIGQQTGETVRLTSSVNPEILGGIIVRVGNQILDASIRARLERLRRTVATA
ncbi:MAG: ATP synthase F1 subunit delta [Actinomycetes bacterium]|nr:ATP synthase F1 subunit delta [Solirubrobacterales bacterium]